MINYTDTPKFHANAAMAGDFHIKTARMKAAAARSNYFYAKANPDVLKASMRTLNSFKWWWDSYESEVQALEHKQARHEVMALRNR